ncbi:MAG: calcium-translocating P-type ATPase, SERCA-type [Bdellovibrio sp.]
MKDGLTSSEIQNRIEIFGKNVLTQEKPPSLFQVFIKQFKDLMIVILLIAALISALMGDMADTLAIITILALNAIIGTIQESKAHKALSALSHLSTTHVMSLRQGIWKMIDATELLPGDIVKVEAGQVIAADMRLIESVGLECDESALTGESLPILKNEKSEPSPGSPLGDHLNTLYRGVTAIKGRGLAVVVAIGEDTEMGKISNLARSSILPKTPLTVKLDQFSKSLSLWLLLICVLVFLLGLYRGEELINIFMTAVTLAVAAIPEALPAVVSVTLAMGARQMAKQKALVKNLKSVETLGSVDIICTDKTGTLTENKMQVKSSFAYLSERQNDLCLAALLCEDVQESNGELLGDPTEVALVAWANKNPLIAKKASLYKRLGEVPFDSQRKRMSVSVTNGERTVLFTKGAPEALIPLLNSEDEKLWLQSNSQHLASKGQRTMAFAYREDHNINEENLNLLGILSLEDPLRFEVPHAIEKCHQAGIKVVMITGDHKQTAWAIGHELKLINKDSLAIEGRDLSNFDFDQNLSKLSIVARANPEDKIKLIEKFLEQGHVVAMTGDGVNDAAALKQAHIGVAMGQRGTDAARESSDMILLDDNFATIERAIEEGRRLYANILKFIKFLLMGNTAEIIVVAFAPILGLGSPLSPLHILWVNLMTDSLPGLALSQGPVEPGVLNEKPRKLNQPLLDKFDFLMIFIMGLLTALCCLGIYIWGLKHRPEVASTLTFSALVFSQLWLSLAISSRETIFNWKTLIAQKWLLLVILFEMGLHFLIFTIEPIAHFIDGHTLDGTELLLTMVCAVVPALAFELSKLKMRKAQKV